MESEDLQGPVVNGLRPWRQSVLVQSAIHQEGAGVKGRGAARGLLSDLTTYTTIHLHSIRGMDRRSGLLEVGF